AKNLCKSFVIGKEQVKVLQNISLQLFSGESLAITGASGSGKSTLLHLLGGLDKADSGEVLLINKNLQTLNDTDLSLWRNQNLGFIYQFHHLLPELSAEENVAMPLLIRRIQKSEALKKSREILAAVGLAKRLKHRPSELSGGERQRAAIARAMVNEPKCILADEPTGNLDSKTANIIFDLLLQQTQQRKMSLIIVTHDERLATKTDRQFCL
ncbi:MAG: ABC transporter ATP-binding protein, partial [Rhodocyclaceae bacterium]